MDDHHLAGSERGGKGSPRVSLGVLGERHCRTNHRETANDAAQQGALVEEGGGGRGGDEEATEVPMGHMKWTGKQVRTVVQHD